METIEALQKKNNVSDAVFEGTKAMKGWKTGKQVDDEEFIKAVETFKKAPADGREEAQG